MSASTSSTSSAPDAADAAPDIESSRVLRRLDAFEERVPAGIPRATFRLQRSVATRLTTFAGDAGRTVWSSISTIVTTQKRAYATVAGTAVAATDTAKTAARTVVAQAKAQARQVQSTVVDETSALVDDAGDAVGSAADTAVDVLDAADAAIRPGSVPTNEHYDDLTVDELYRRARALDIDGRSRMSKKELIAAVSAAS